MKSINNFLSSVAEACHPSKGTFSGAMDVIVIRSPDGTMKSTPFYVKFGRFKLMKSSNIKVRLIVKDQQTDVFMELKKSGRAIFLSECSYAPDPVEEIAKQGRDSPNLLLEEDSAKEIPNFFENRKTSVFNAVNLSANVPESQNPIPAKEEEVKHEVIPEDNQELKRSNSSIGVSRITLDSEGLSKLNLDYEMNIVRYVTETKNPVEVVGRIFLWDYSHKIVISDIDGTLTKSDVMGHLCYFLGKDWSRGGVVNLYNRIITCGYKILYLSSRSLSQTKSTLGLLTFMDQDGQKLPPGPVLLSTEGMLRSIAREISNYSQVYKVNTLKAVKAAYPSGCEVFYAGFGNRSGDAVAYKEMGIPADRIFILKSKKKKNSDECAVISHFNEVMEALDKVFPQLNIINKRNT